MPDGSHALVSRSEFYVSGLESWCGRLFALASDLSLAVQDGRTPQTSHRIIPIAWTTAMKTGWFPVQGTHCRAVPLQQGPNLEWLEWHAGELVVPMLKEWMVVELFDQQVNRRYVLPLGSFVEPVDLLHQVHVRLFKRPDVFVVHVHPRLILVVARLQLETKSSLCVITQFKPFTTPQLQSLCWLFSEHGHWTQNQLLHATFATSSFGCPGNHWMHAWTYRQAHN